MPETNRNDAFAVAEKIRQEIEASEVMHKDNPLKVTVSIGVAGFPMDARERAPLIKKAAMALYASKESGRSRVSLVGTLVIEDKGAFRR